MWVIRTSMPKPANPNPNAQKLSHIPELDDSRIPSVGVKEIISIFDVSHREHATDLQHLLALVVIGSCEV